uniref:Uncharacterized protein n=1 Tax=Lepeophtheirus salmonis TaxID=72036 RepID=A0A0K2VGL3_LEPSM
MATLYNNSYYFTNYDFPENSSPPGGRRLRMSVIEYLLYNMASMLASVAAGYDVRLSNLSAINPKLYPNNLDNEEKELKFWYSDSRVSRNSSSLYPHNTFHGLPVNNRVPLNSAVNFKSLRLTESTSHPSPSSPSVRRSSNASSSEDGKDVQYPPPPPVATGPGLDRPLFLSGQDYSSSDGHYTTTNNNNSYQSGGGYTMMRTQMFYQDQMDSIGSVGGCVHHDPYHVPPSRQYVETARRLDSLESVRSRQVSIEFPRSRGLDLIDHTVDQSSIRNRITEGYIDPNEPVDLRL